MDSEMEVSRCISEFALDTFTHTGLQSSQRRVPKLVPQLQSHMVNTQQDLRSFFILFLENTGRLLLPFMYRASKVPVSLMQQHGSG
jgi:hypothetical protein